MTKDILYESFLNANNRKKELEKMKRIQNEIFDKTQKIEKKPKRKSPKKSKFESDSNEISIDEKEIIDQ